MPDLDAIRARADAATPGPWGWFGNLKAGGPYLATHHGGRRFVMQFARLGMQGAQPVFQIYDHERGWGHMVEGRELAILEAPHRDDIVGFDNPDATFLAHARQDVADLLQLVDGLRALVLEFEEGRDALFEFDDLHGLLDRTDLRHWPHGPGRCRVCGCTDLRACNPPCSWADADHTLCSACKEGVDTDG